MDGERMTIVLADDHVVVRRGLRLLLEGEQEWEVVAEAGTVPDAVRETRAHRPAVLVLDLTMPGGSALLAIAALRASTPASSIVVLTMHDDPEYARRALAAGAAAYVLKEAADEELRTAVRTAAAGGSYLTPRLGAQLAVGPRPRQGPPGGLSAREAEVLGLVALGHTSSEIGARLDLSARTIDTHREHIHAKLGCSGRAALVRYALDHGLVEIPVRRRPDRLAPGVQLG